MLNLSLSDITKRVQQYADSPSGKKQIKKVLSEKQKSGELLANGQAVLGDTGVHEAVQIFISIIQKHLPNSISEVGNTLHLAETIKKQSTHEAVIKFDVSTLHRDSLYDEGYAGIDNIVALLNNGYRASGYVYGWWDGHSPTGGAAEDLRNTSRNDYAWIRSMKEREALHFMQDAVNEFNSLYGEKYNVTAVLGSDYTK